MVTIIQDSLAKSHSYSEYRNIVSSLLKEGKSTGNEQSEALTHYSELNETRMNRLEKTIKITDEFTEILKQLKREYIWLVVSEGWCGDAAQLVPIFHKMAELSPKIDFRIVFRDENDDLMNLFLTNGARSIPKLIILDKNTLEVLGDFGPRPQGAKQLILDYKAEHGIVDETAKTNLQLWYLHDKGLSTQQEIMDLIATLELTAVQIPQD
ncbi:thioredoxin family protein [Flavobacterium sp. J49]|uniref:thioredoxin family protein n=1 Tax=Flavobacterium sp. J49 TaxID=2718534 RepID=UPI001594C65F|nr:thioredoxin family protein [Flavobacterium sp. J49]MBF6641731.1 thioredoxin family protein [Flavobacterium sp. J49]NIC02978.1 thioredoxin family protein [Flavobacterium sp. J49]